MVIRDRLISLIYRSFALAIALVTLIVNISANAVNGIWNSFLNYSTLVTLVGFIVIFAEVIANIVGIKKNRFTLAPGILPLFFHAGLTLEIGLAFSHPLYCHFIQSAYFKASTALFVLLTYIVLPLLLLIDWILFGEKGTVRWSYGMFPLFFPIFYYLFSLMRHLVMNVTTYVVQIFNPNTFLMSGNLPAFFSNANGWAGVFISCISILALTAFLDFLMILINNILAGRYSKNRNF